MLMKRKSANKARINVGDRVRFVFGTSKVVATIVEDMGHIGVGGRRLLVVAFPFGGELRKFDMPEKELTLVPRRRTAARKKHVRALNH